MKKIIEKILLVTLLGISISYTVVNAETLTLNENELDSVVNELNSQIIEKDNKKYTVSNVNVEESKENSQKIEFERTLTDLETNNEETIRSLFGETYSYSDTAYKGNLNLDTVKIEVQSQNIYEKIKKHNIPFKNYSSNDLNNIEKTITISGNKYYLTNVDWVPDKTEIRDEHEVVISYKGTIHYETIIKYMGDPTYTATAKYTGTVDIINKEYIVTYDLNEQEESNIIPIVSTIIISGLGITLVIFLIFSKNIKVYNIINGKQKLVKSYRVSKDKLKLDLRDLKILGSNICIFKIKKSLFKQIKGKRLKIKTANGVITEYPVTEEKFTVSL